MGNPVILHSAGGPWKRLFDTSVAAADANFVSGGLAARPYATPFANAANLKLIDLREGSAPGAPTPNAVQFRFFGTDASNEAFSARVWGIEEGIGTVGTTKTKSWEATLLAQYLATLGNVNGVAGTLIEAADFEADTIALTFGASADSVILSGLTDLKQAWARLDFLGFPILAVEFEDTTAATCNALYRFLW